MNIIGLGIALVGLVLIIHAIYISFQINRMIKNHRTIWSEEVRRWIELTRDVIWIYVCFLAAYVTIVGLISYGLEFDLGPTLAYFVVLVLLSFFHFLVWFIYTYIKEVKSNPIPPSTSSK